MMSWMAERDRLLAQTKAFVKEVAAAHPKTAPSVPHRTLIPGPPRGDAGIAIVSTVPKLPQSAATPVSRPAAEQPIAEISHPAEPETERVTAAPVRKAASGEADHGVIAVRSSSPSPTADLVLTIPRVATSERDDIAIRVSQFREHQKRLSREREQFSEQMRARIRSVLGHTG